MLYTSTRNNEIRVTAAQAIAQGISEEGGLFVPVELPHFSMDTVREMMEMSYIDRAKTVLRTFLTDFSNEELNYCVEGAYRADKFSSPAVAPTVNIGGKENILELWHGPTCAFKDMALQLLPYLMTVSAKKTAEGKTIVILVATSGDTGKAALEGFKDVDKTKILVFYPVDGVSPMQKLQMTTQEGENVAVCAIHGNFDDAQSAVKSIFTNDEIKAELAKKNMMFSSANSINWGRLVPQIVYYFSAYVDAVKAGKIAAGDPINFVVPTGNFGDILAGYYAKMMGLPIDRLLCASNSNNVLTDFINTGVYDRRREFFKTASPSMDILVSSNLERLLYSVTEHDAARVADYMKRLNTEGHYEIDSDDLKQIQSQFFGAWVDELETKEAIGRIYNDYHYLMDTHTAVAWRAMEKYRFLTSDETYTVVLSTASPYKFADSVLAALDDAQPQSSNPFELLQKLHADTGTEIPPRMLALENLPVLHSEVIPADKMELAVVKNLV